MGEPISARRLNELLTKMYERRIIRALYQDPTLPWLPRSYWEEDYLAKVAVQPPEGAPLYFRGELVSDEMVRRMKRRQEDMKLEANASVEALLEEGIPTLQGDNQELIDAGWGQKSMHQGWHHPARTPSTRVAPSFTHECFQCGRPITDEGSGHGRWVDHANRSKCDLALLDQEQIDAEDYWTDHQPKPFRGEEEDDDDDE